MKVCRCLLCVYSDKKIGDHSRDLLILSLRFRNKRRSGLPQEFTVRYHASRAVEHSECMAGANAPRWYALHPIRGHNLNDVKGVYLVMESVSRYARCSDDPFTLRATGFVNLSKIPILNLVGGDQFRKFCLLSTLILVVTVSITCITQDERGNRSPASRGKKWVFRTFLMISTLYFLVISFMLSRTLEALSCSCPGRSGEYATCSCFHGLAGLRFRLPVIHETLTVAKGSPFSFTRKPGCPTFRS